MFNSGILYEWLILLEMIQIEPFFSKLSQPLFNHFLKLIHFLHVFWNIWF